MPWCSGSYFMTGKNQNKALLWIGASLVVLLIGGFAYRKYIEMRMAGASGGDAFMFMVFVFIGILILVAIVLGFVFYYFIPESVKVYHGLKHVRNKKIGIKEELQEIESQESDETLPEIDKEEIARQEAELKRQHEEMLTSVIAYSVGTFKKILSTEEAETLAYNIRKFDVGDGTYSPINSSKLSLVTPIDLFHFGWNIGRRILPPKGPRKMGVEVAIFLKDTFDRRLTDYAVETIQAKLTTNDGKFTLKKIKPDQPLVPHVFPFIEE